ncbi:MAG TPA: protein phosphatase 2C domain-containing protein [Anaerolineales bacterium]|nr:protein phosphatase 2C domain-containing protein [Anaerolineales bacterium]
MTDLVLAKHFAIGGRVLYEDRVEATRLRTAGGLELTLAIVADGVGGEAMGERASQITLDSILNYLPRGAESDVVELLANALHYANQQVYRIAQAEARRGMASTAALAAVVDGKTLYVASVGDSPIFLCRGRRLTRLTVDHTHATQLVRSGRMSREEAEKQPGGLSLVQAIGAQESVEPDVGFYVGIENPRVAAQRGRQGLPLRRGDSVLVCSDGLVKPSVATGPAVRKEEIISVLGASSGDEAARTLIAFALGRQPDDNVSVAVIQWPDPGRAARIRATRSLSLLTAAATVGVLLVGFVYLLRERDRLNQANGALAAAATQAQAEAAATQLSVVLSTPTLPATPVPMPSPTFSEGAYVRDLEVGTVPVGEDGLVGTGGRGALVVVPASGEGANAVFVVGPSTRLALQAITSRKALVSLGTGGAVLVWNGGLPDGVVVSFGPSGSWLTLPVGCAMLSPSADTASIGWDVTCWGGECSYSAAVGEGTIPIQPWERLALTWDPLETAVFPVGEVDLERLQAILSSAPAELDPEALACLTP